MNDSVAHVVLLDIDGLRWGVFDNALREGQIPNLAALLGDQPLTMPIVSTASSITFAAQASLITGRHPADHGIAGNQFFDRFGDENDPPKFYAFDLGDTLEVSSAVGVFTEKLANRRLQVPTIFDKFAAAGHDAVVATHMYPGQATWLKPAVTHLARFLKGGNLLGLSPEDFDQATIGHLENYIVANGLPPVMMGYLMGLDFESHHHGPAYQIHSLQRIDRQIGHLVELIGRHAQGPLLTAVFSDHGQISTPDAPDKAVQLGFPFGQELARFFKELNLDVHDYPGEAPDCDAVIALNGGTAAVYLHNKIGRWRAKPDFARDVLPIALAFWEAAQHGRHEPALKNSLDSVLIRNVEQNGWDAPYQALTREGEIVPLEQWFADHTQQPAIDPVNRLNRYVNRYAGDLMLVSNLTDGYYFGNPHKGTHGGLHPECSTGTLAFGSNSPQALAILQRIDHAIHTRCRAENGRHRSVVDLATGLESVIN